MRKNRLNAQIHLGTGNGFPGCFIIIRLNNKLRFKIGEITEAPSIGINLFSVLKTCVETSINSITNNTLNMSASFERKETLFIKRIFFKQK